ncbi:helix-turn-helix transcriptional regulator [Mycobacterium sp. 050272]|uniref:helix-turn-helix transcriptional regulator n=1 Tax=Mycobacterium sp. 050272 TaxID=3142488 RepID=UPI00319255C8
MSRSNGDRPPIAYVMRGVWPDAELDPDAPPSAPAAQRLARALRGAMNETATGQRALAATSGVAHTTIGRILAGTVLCDIGSLARLEHALGRPLWQERTEGRIRPRSKRSVTA